MVGENPDWHRCFGVYMWSSPMWAGGARSCAASGAVADMGSGAWRRIPVAWVQKPAGCPAEQPQSISVLVLFPKSNGAWQGNNTAMIELCGVNVKHSYKVWGNTTKLLVCKKYCLSWKFHSTGKVDSLLYIIACLLDTWTHCYICFYYVLNFFGILVKSRTSHASEVNLLNPFTDTNPCCYFIWLYIKTWCSSFLSYSI